MTSYHTLPFSVFLFGYFTVCRRAPPHDGSVPTTNKQYQRHGQKPKYTNDVVNTIISRNIPSSKAFSGK